LGNLSNNHEGATFDWTSYGNEALVVPSAAEEQRIKTEQNLQPARTAGFGQYKRRNGPGYELTEI